MPHYIFIIHRCDPLLSQSDAFETSGADAFGILVLKYDAFFCLPGAVSLIV